MDTDCGEGRRGKLNLLAEPAAEPEADPWYSYYGHGLRHYGYGHGYYGYRPYGHYGYGLWGRKKREAEPVAEPAAEPEADPWYSYYGHGLRHYGYGPDTTATVPMDTMDTDCGEGRRGKLSLQLNLQRNLQRNLKPTPGTATMAMAFVTMATDTDTTATVPMDTMDTDCGEGSRTRYYSDLQTMILLGPQPVFPESS